MDPYTRFKRVASFASATVVVAALAVGGPAFFSGATASGQPGEQLLALAGLVVLVVVGWLALTEAVFPMLFRSGAVRRLILGRYHIEGTWLQSERGQNGERLVSVIDIQALGDGFILSGYALNDRLEIENNTLVEIARTAWPFLAFRSRNSLSDGSDGQREALGEIQFEMNTAAARRYNGYIQLASTGQRRKLEGVRLTKGRDVRKLRTLEGRREVMAHYWSMMFDSTPLRIRGEEAPLPTVSERYEQPDGRFGAVGGRAPSAPPPPPHAAHDGMPDDRRIGQPAPDGPVIPRRRAADWQEGFQDAQSGIDQIVEAIRQEKQRF